MIYYEMFLPRLRALDKWESEWYRYLLKFLLAARTNENPLIKSGRFGPRNFIRL